MEHNHDTTQLLDFAMSDPNAILSSIVRVVMEASNFPFNLTFITLFQQD